jgi:hypothetical protein
MVALENGLSFFKCIARSDGVCDGLFGIEGFIRELMGVVGKEGKEEWKVARENAPMMIVNIISAGPDVQIGLATHSNLLPTLLLLAAEDEDVTKNP